MGAVKDKDDSVQETQEAPSDDTDTEEKYREEFTDIHIVCRKMEEKTLEGEQRKIRDTEDVEYCDDRGVSQG
jgi:hypothetical protein